MSSLQQKIFLMLEPNHLGRPSYKVWLIGLISCKICSYLDKLPAEKIAFHPKIHWD